jgi:PPM family protein phosphatase
MADDRWVLTATVLTHRGAVRPANEDTVGVGDWISPDRMDEPAVITLPVAAPRIVVVADGMGGHVEGARASRATVALLLQQGVSVTESEELVALLRQANAELYEAMGREPRLDGMGATIAGLLMSPPRCFAFNVGDSRVFVERSGYLRQLSQDDAWPASDGAYDPLKTGSSGVVTQAIGGRSAFVDIEPHVVEAQLLDGQRFLVCSDGLTDAVALDELEASLSNHDDRAVVRGWFESAMRSGARDNLSILLVRVSRAAGSTGSE